MQTRRLFDNDSHMHRFEAFVLACEPAGDAYDLVLDQTAFFPEGGGQPPDSGVLAELPVLDVQERVGVIRHRVAAPVPVGTKVEGRIDWTVRFSLMQQHSGEHIVSGFIRSRHGFDNVGFHIGSDCVTVDYNGELTDDDLAVVETLANEAIFSNLPVLISQPEPDALRRMAYRSKLAREEGIRIVSIPGCDVCACCGTHVARTGEIGLVKILSGRRHKGGTRVEMLCGALAVKDYEARHRQVTDISVALSAKPLEVADAVRRLQAENDALKRQLADWREARLEARAAAAVASWCAGEEAAIPHMYPEAPATQLQVEEIRYPGQGRVLIVAGLQPADVRRLCLMLVEKAALAGKRPAWIGVISPMPEEGCLYAVACVPEPREPWAQLDCHEPVIRDARRVAQHLNAVCAGRGGGSPALAQGSVQAGMEAVVEGLRRLQV